MQIVIKVSDERYKDIQRIAEVQLGLARFQTAEQIIAKGTPLPKGYWRLIDKDHMIARLEVASKFYGGENADAFDERFSHGLKEAVIKVCEEPTIIEADKAGEEE